MKHFCLTHSASKRLSVSHQTSWHMAYIVLSDPWVLTSIAGQSITTHVLISLTHWTLIPQQCRTEYYTLIDFNVPNYDLCPISTVKLVYGIHADNNTFIPEQAAIWVFLFLDFMADCFEVYLIKKSLLLSNIIIAFSFSRKHSQFSFV